MPICHGGCAARNRQVSKLCLSPSAVKDHMQAQSTPGDTALYCRARSIKAAARTKAEVNDQATAMESEKKCLPVPKKKHARETTCRNLPANLAAPPPGCPAHLRCTCLPDCCSRDPKHRIAGVLPTLLWCAGGDAALLCRLSEFNEIPTTRCSQQTYSHARNRTTFHRATATCSRFKPLRKFPRGMTHP